MGAPFSPGQGFADPSIGPQTIFRAVLEAMSRPGQVIAVPDEGVRGPDDVPGSVLALLLALADHDTPIWLDEDLRAGSLPRWLAFHTGTPLASDPAQAAFGLLRADRFMPPLASFALGDPRYPDRSTTLLVLCEALQGGAPLRLDGPGIETTIALSPRGLPENFVAQAQENHSLYPQGVDCLLLAGPRMAGLPRSTRIVPEPR